MPATGAVREEVTCLRFSKPINPQPPECAPDGSRRVVLSLHARLPDCGALARKTRRDLSSCYAPCWWQLSACFPATTVGMAPDDFRMPIWLRLRGSAGAYCGWAATPPEYLRLRGATVAAAGSRNLPPPPPPPHCGDPAHCCAAKEASVPSQLKTTDVCGAGVRRARRCVAARPLGTTVTTMSTRSLGTFEPWNTSSQIPRTLFHVSAPRLLLHDAQFAATKLRPPACHPMCGVWPGQVPLRSACLADAAGARGQCARSGSTSARHRPRRRVPTARPLPEVFVRLPKVP